MNNRDNNSINPSTKKPYRLIIKSQQEFDEKINN